jgi:hypothetical protein
MAMRIEVRGKRAEGLERGDHAWMDVFVVENLLEAFSDALVGGL